MRLLRVPGVADKDRVRLVMLYTLRFEGDALRVRQLMEFLVTAGVRDRCVSIPHHCFLMNPLPAGSH